MKMNLAKTIGALLLLTALWDCATQAQAVADEPKRREGEIWFEPIKAEVGGQAYEGERGHLMVRENRKNPNSNLIELVFIRLKSTSDKPAPPTVYLDPPTSHSPQPLGWGVKGALHHDPPTSHSPQPLGWG